MADTAGTLTYQMLQDGVMGQGQSARFPAQRLADARRWLAAAYSAVWDTADWTFKSVYDEDLAVLAGNPRPTLPATFASVLGLYDQKGNRLSSCQPEEFQDLYQSQTTAGTPQAYMVVDRRIVLGPTPSASATFSLSYRRRLCHRDANKNLIAGFFDDTETTSIPLWDDHHYLLIPRAQIVGLKTLNDPSWPQLLDEYTTLMSGMVNDYLDYPPEPLQYGRDGL